MLFRQPQSIPDQSHNRTRPHDLSSYPAKKARQYPTHKRGSKKACRNLTSPITIPKKWGYQPPAARLELATFRLKVWRANQLRHVGLFLLLFSLKLSCVRVVYESVLLPWQWRWCGLEGGLVEVGKVRLEMSAWLDDRKAHQSGEIDGWDELCIELMFLLKGVELLRGRYVYPRSLRVTKGSEVQT